ncbi:ATP-dependent RNA helicase [Corynebacterium sputi]|uniref:ATP-dependent RNA helicase n=1 Tax=Corynebacterium sputi TaxID=489915 RepID=UPI00047C65C6|nr:ATP-dependent RNA helicase [Corynebacterium sputi]
MSFDITRIGDDLPFSGAVETLTEALRTAGVAVVQAPPGTGKTTVVPPVVANTVDGRVVVTAPRRVSVRAAARRLAQLSGTRLGEEVGYTVRGDSKRSARTQVEFCTPGVLLRRLLSDPELPGISAVVLDEVHERGLDTDLVLAMLCELRELREDLTVVAMSATVDAARFAELLGAPIVDSPAVLHELDIRYAPSSGPRLGPRGVEFDFLDHVAAQALSLSDALSGDILTFVPGVREVDRVIATIKDRSSITVLPLHGRLSSAEQDRVLAGSIEQRIIVSTVVAESSLTVPGVRGVVDACLARGPRIDLARGMSGLVTTSCAKSSAQQRSGRAARLGPGVAIRCISEAEWRNLDAWPAPEITVADLTQAMLDLAAWGTPGGEGLPLPDAPPPTHVHAAHQALHSIGAMEDGQITELGQTLAKLPLDPRMGRALLTAMSVIGAKRAADATAALSDDDPKRLQKLTGETPFAKESAPKVPDISLVAALARPDRIARRRSPDSDEFLTIGGTAATAPASFGGMEWLAITDVSRTGSGARVRSAEPATRELAEWAAAALLTRTTEVTMDTSVRAREKTCLGAIELASHPVRPTPAQCREAIFGAGVDVVKLTSSAETFRARLALLHAQRGAPWPDVSDAGLAEQLETLLANEADSPTPGPIGVDQLRRLLPWPEASELESLVPERLPVPSGSNIRIDYSGEEPVLAVKLQECFGMADTPTILGIPVVLHMLSPAGRPLAVTKDLRSFWAGPYLQVRAEMRGRYPKHPWPEDPWSAQATKRTKNNSR